MPLRQPDKFLSLSPKVLIEKDGEARATSMYQETLAEYERIFQGMPDIGGNSKFTLRKMQAAARHSQERKFAGDWVFKVVVGDGLPFHFGIDYTECAIKFVEKQYGETSL